MYMRHIYYVIYIEHIYQDELSHITRQLPAICTKGGR